MQNITRVKCIWPFTKFTVHHHGFCFSCCRPWSKIGSVGRLTTQDSIMDIWNSESMQYIRKAVLDDELWKACDYKRCPFAIKGEYYYLEAMKNEDPNFNHVLDQMMRGQTILDSPPHIFEVGSSGKCNLKCVMCQVNDKCLKYDGDWLDQKLYTQIIPSMLPGLSRLSLTANGEVLFNPYSRKFLQSLDSKQYPLLRIDLLTNGTLLTPKLWESIRHNQYELISVSIDAASKETYEKIRKNGNWDVLRRNLDLISKLRRENVFKFFSINFCVMKSNYREMKEFVELGLHLGCDKIIFQKILGLSDIRENINYTYNIKAFSEIGKVLDDPVFNHPQVETAIVNQYRKYKNRRVFFWHVWVTRLLEWLLYFPVKLGAYLKRSSSFLVVFYEFLIRKRVKVGNQPG